MISSAAFLQRKKTNGCRDKFVQLFHMLQTGCLILLNNMGMFENGVYPVYTPTTAVQMGKMVLFGG